jgi:NitT/TauT family transport system permease protein
MTRRSWINAVWPPALVFLAIVLTMELIVRGGLVPSYLVPAPSKVFTTLLSSNDGADLLRATGETAKAAGAGFLLSAIAGVALAIALSSARWIQRAFYPYAIFFQTVPIIAIAPLLVIWIGFDIRTVIASAFIVSVFPVIANTLTGLLSTDPALRDLFRLYGASHAAALWKLRLPFALPNIMTGLRIAAGLSVIGAIVGEFITGSGLGGVIDIARTQQRIDKSFAGLIWAAALGIALFAIVNATSRYTLRNWHASEKGDLT